MLQEDWKAGESIFTRLSAEAYQDCVDSDILLKGSHRIITPKYIMNGLPEIYQCLCGKSFSPMCSAVKKVVEITDPFFIDDSFIMYQPPPDSTVWSRLGLLRDASVQKQEPPQQEQIPLLEAQPLETPAQE